MARLYADECFPGPIVQHLRALGHDALTALEDGRANQGIADPAVLARAIALDRAVLTNDREDYRKLHRADPAHAGIITCTRDSDFAAVALRVHAAVSVLPTLAGQLIRVIRPNLPPPKVP